MSTVLPNPDLETCSNFIFQPTIALLRPRMRTASCTHSVRWLPVSQHTKPAGLSDLQHCRIYLQQTCCRRSSIVLSASCMRSWRHQTAAASNQLSHGDWCQDRPVNYKVGMRDFQAALEGAALTILLCLEWALVKALSSTYKSTPLSSGMVLLWLRPKSINTCMTVLQWRLMCCWGLHAQNTWHQSQGPRLHSKWIALLAAMAIAQAACSVNRFWQSQKLHAVHVSSTGCRLTTAESLLRMSMLDVVKSPCIKPASCRVATVCPILAIMTSSSAGQASTLDVKVSSSYLLSSSWVMCEWPAAL